MIIRLSVRLKMELEKDQIIFDYKSKRIIIIKKIVFLDW